MSEPPHGPSGVEILKEQSDALRVPLLEEFAASTTHITDAGYQILKFHGSYQQDDRDLRDLLGGDAAHRQLRADHLHAGLALAALCAACSRAFAAACRFGRVASNGAQRRTAPSVEDAAPPSVRHGHVDAQRVLHLVLIDRP